MALPVGIHPGDAAIRLYRGSPQHELVTAAQVDVSRPAPRRRHPRAGGLTNGTKARAAPSARRAPRTRPARSSIRSLGPARRRRRSEEPNTFAEQSTNRPAPSWARARREGRRARLASLRCCGRRWCRARRRRQAVRIDDRHGCADCTMVHNRLGDVRVIGTSKAALLGRSRFRKCGAKLPPARHEELHVLEHVGARSRVETIGGTMRRVDGIQRIATWTVSSAPSRFLTRLYRRTPRSGGCSGEVPLR
jgi:hypothetical protein